MARTLKTIAKAINKKITNETRTAIELGILLAEARDSHFTTVKGDKEKVEGAKLQEWAGENFGFKKAQIYAYIKIGMVFSTDELQEQFDSVPVSVLHALTRDGEMLNAAAAAIEDGETVDVSWMKKYKEELDKLAKAAKSESDEDEEDEEDEETESSSSGEPQDDKYVLELEARIETLEEEIKNAEGSDSLDMTAHFQAVAKFLNGKSPEQVLFIATGITDKRTVNKAKRDVMKLYDASIASESAAPVIEVIEAAAAHILGIENPATEEAPKKEKKAKKAKK